MEVLEKFALNVDKFFNGLVDSTGWGLLRMEKVAFFGG
jgi:hypothetical protein